jgi:hypothetical protein
MPIRLNLFAESQAAEELRRRDPVKRAIWGAICIVLLVLVWSSSLQVKIIADNGRLGSLEGKLDSKTNEYSQVLDSQKRLADAKNKLNALNRLAANRFLQATLLDAFQHSPVDGIQINRMRTEQNYEVVAETPATKLESGKTMPGKPGYSAERIKLYLDARDASSSPGIMQVNKFKDIISQTHYFEGERISSNSISLKSITPPTFDADTQRPFVLFSLECMYPERMH